MVAYDGRDVVVTGGTGGLGRAVVEGLVAAGARCHVPVLDPSELERFSLARHARVRVVAGVDLTDEGDVEAFYGELPGLWASLQIVGGFAMAPLAQTRASDLQRMLTLNAMTCMLACREAVEAMRRGGGGGRLVNVAARPALAPVGGMVAYVAAKSAVVGMTLALADELKAEGIAVNAVAPSIMDTAANRAAMPEADPSAWPKVEDVARAMIWLASPDNALTTGLVMPVYGQA